MLSHQTRVITRPLSPFLFTTTTLTKLSLFSSMTNQVQIHTTQLRHDQGGARSLLLKGPSKAKILTVVALLPVGLILLGLAGIALAGTMAGVAVATPVLVIFSPVIVPATLAVGIAVAGFLTSGTFGLTGLSSLSSVVKCVRQGQGQGQGESQSQSGEKT